MIRGALFLAAALICATAAAQEVARPDGPPLIPSMMENLPPPNATALTRWDGGARAQAYAMVGREDRISQDRNRPPELCRLAVGDAVASISERARSAQVVVINEAHDSPRDRALIADAAEALAALGFKTYAAETFFDRPVDVVSYPRLSEGSYSNEPAFGELLRRVARLDYRLVEYEFLPPQQPNAHFSEAINARDAGQASNLINRTVRDQRDLKILVHVGYGHNLEAVQRLDGREIRWLALRFKEITGIDPLTIDQTSFVADRTGVCATKSDGTALPTDRDIYIAHPPLAFERGRPTWRLARGQRFAEIPQALKRAGERVVYEARYADEPDDAVPADRLLVDPGEDIPLLLKPGRYRVRAWTQEGVWTRSVPLTVADPTVRAPQNTKAKNQRRKKR